MKQVCWHSRRSKAYRGLPEARGQKRGSRGTGTQKLAALSGGAGSSLTSELIICAMTGWFLHDPSDGLDEGIGGFQPASAPGLRLLCFHTGFVPTLL